MTDKVTSGTVERKSTVANVQFTIGAVDQERGVVQLHQVWCLELHNVLRKIIELEVARLAPVDQVA